ncbi:restriction endonuclease subunit S [Brevibacillus ruminantium]|uniref:Restriction endonuclease subunit S n=1 Tax=Brevibacillus ruminantium TaxID=2950604 RepID=A0ABY4WHA2_9BACL|nr:restriction endonuclease subunit S [Brevibacillus ruminantium]USG66525.1 restriction endonuclease subunit S [Brevibacillus ruminantium]
MRTLGGITVDYLNICLSYYDFIPLTSGSTGRRKLTQAALMDAEILLPPLEEQQEIVNIIYQVTTGIGNTWEHYLEVQRNVDTITQSILFKAFRGELGTNNSKAENAIELLKETLAQQLK